MSTSHFIGTVGREEGIGGFGFLRCRLWMYGLGSNTFRNEERWKSPFLHACMESCACASHWLPKREPLLGRSHPETSCKTMQHLKTPLAADSYIPMRSEHYCLVSRHLRG